MINFSKRKALKKREERLKEILEKRIDELKEESDDLNAKFDMYLRNHKEPPAYLREKILENMSESGPLHLQCYPYTPDEAALKRMEALDRKEEAIANEIKSTMPDLPAAKVAFILPIVEESLKAYTLNYQDFEIHFRHDCIMSLFFDIFLEYRDSNGILSKTVAEISDQWFEYDSMAGYRDYILGKLANIQDCILNPTEENILTACVNMDEVSLAYSAMVLFEMDLESKEQQ